MAHSVVIPVDVEFNMNKAQLNGISKAIDAALKTKNIKTKDFFAPINNSAKKLSVNLKGLKLGDFFNSFSNSAKKLSSSLSHISTSVKSLSSSFSGLRGIAAQALSIAAIGNVGKKMVKLSSDIIEIQNVVDTVFEDMADDINDFAKSALNSFGLTQLQAKNFASVFGGLLEASDITGEAQKEMSINLTKLTGDVASFYNLDYDEVFNKLQSGLTGEVKAMRAFGVNMTVANMEAWALSKGITKSYDSMSQAEKTALRYNYMLEKLSNAQGDFSKTQGSWANQTRILVSQIQQLGAIFGGFLQKILYPILTVINQIIGLAISGASALAKMFGFDMESLQVQQGVAGTGAGVALGDIGASAMDDLADSTDDATKAQKKLNKEQNKSLANIHELNVLSSNKSSSGSSGGSGSSGVGIGGAGGIGFDLSKYKDISETNNPISLLMESMMRAAKDGNWRGIGSLLAADVNEVMSKIDLAQYIPKIQAGAKALADILNGFVQNLHFDDIGRIIGEGINLMLAGINTFFDQFDFISLGQQLAVGLNSLINTVDFVALGQFLVNKLNAVFQTLAGFVTSFNWSDLGLKLAEGINSIFDNFDFESFSIAVYAGINGVFESIGTAILNLNWGSIGSEFAKSFSTIFGHIDYGLILSTIIKGIEGILVSLSTFFAEIDWASIAEQLKVGINTAISVLGDVDFSTIASNISTGLINLVSSLAELIKGIDWMQLGANLYEGIKSIVLSIDWSGLIGSIGELIFNAVGALSTTLLTLVAGLVTDIMGVLWGIAGYISDMLKSTIAVVMEFVGNIIGLVITNLTSLATNITGWLGNTLGSITGWFSTLVSNITSWLGNILGSITGWFTSLITNIASWLGNILGSLTAWFTSLPSKIGGWLSGVGSTISGWFTGIWTNFTSFLGNIITYITGTFSNAWSKAWDGIKSVFSSIFDTIGGVFKSVINTVIDAINTVINAINKISWDVPDWVPGIGGSTFGFSIPTVPKLARGAVIPPNQEFLAILGDQKRGVNIETPLDTMLQAFRGALAEFSDYNGGDIIIPIYVNSELSSEEIIRRQDIAQYRSNGK
jgi:phage-related protein|nr:MAG TPA: minor tail protein [Caudoviricetes sp.]